MIEDSARNFEGGIALALNRKESVNLHVKLMTKFPLDEGHSVAKVTANPGILAW